MGWDLAHCTGLRRTSQIPIAIAAMQHAQYIRARKEGACACLRRAGARGTAQCRRGGAPGWPAWEGPARLPGSGGTGGTQSQQGAGVRLLRDPMQPPPPPLPPPHPSPAIRCAFDKPTSPAATFLPSRSSCLAAAVWRIRQAAGGGQPAQRCVTFLHTAAPLQQSPLKLPSQAHSRWAEALSKEGPLSNPHPPAKPEATAAHDVAAPPAPHKGRSTQTPAAGAWTQPSSPPLRRRQLAPRRSTTRGRGPPPDTWPRPAGVAGVLCVRGRGSQHSRGQAG